MLWTGWNRKFARVPWDVKLNQLETVLTSTPHPHSELMAEVHLPFCVPGLKLLFQLRNAATHGGVDSDSTETLVLLSRYRGRHRRHEVPLARLHYARGKLAEALALDLDELALWAADDRVVATWVQP